MSAGEGFDRFDRQVDPLACKRCGAVVEAEHAERHLDWHEQLSKAVERAAGGMISTMFLSEEEKRL